MRPLRALRAWLADRRGVAAVEFALIAPVLLTLTLVGYETAMALSTYRKLTDTTVEMANVAAQYTTMSASDVSTVMNASAQIMGATAPVTVAGHLVQGIAECLFGMVLHQRCRAGARCRALGWRVWAGRQLAVPDDWGAAPCAAPIRGDTTTTSPCRTSGVRE